MPAAAAVVCWEHGRWSPPDLFVPSVRIVCCALAEPASGQPGGEAACLPCAGSAGACQRMREMTPSRGAECFREKPLESCGEKQREVSLQGEVQTCSVSGDRDS